ncbi:hypothetical protein FEK35_24105 [Nocardia cyriacigeorgica]|uniref:Uncharacterized protein n=1 Tax=Nocardia cyriacigeorgica TaxID=135487 RepID=A0A5R8P7Z7_9NOCA|nr:hypothetical protein [Nocardia cyriacigeorgica]TLG00331.1 hypothetical protein FEK35_24105 [Nocardia cyriacigeorgica]
MAAYLTGPAPHPAVNARVAAISVVYCAAGHPEPGRADIFHRVDLVTARRVGLGDHHRAGEQMLSLPQRVHVVLGVPAVVSHGVLTTTFAG